MHMLACDQLTPTIGGKSPSSLRQDGGIVLGLIGTRVVNGPGSGIRLR